MKTTPWIKLCKGAALALAVSYGLTYCHTTKSKLTLEQKGDSLTVIHITYPANYILLPIEEEAMESQVLLDTGEATDTDMDIRLAQTKVDYLFRLPYLPEQRLLPYVCVINQRMHFAGKKSNYLIHLIQPIQISFVQFITILLCMVG